MAIVVNGFFMFGMRNDEGNQLFCYADFKCRFFTIQIGLVCSYDINLNKFILIFYQDLYHILTITDCSSSQLEDIGTWYLIQIQPHWVAPLSIVYTLRSRHGHLSYLYSSSFSKTIHPECWHHQITRLHRQGVVTTLSMINKVDN